MQNTGLTNLLSHLEGISATSEERHGLSGIKTDWKEVRDLWDDHAQLQTLTVGYSKASAEARSAYVAACIAFQAKHGVDFDPERKPE